MKLIRNLFHKKATTIPHGYTSIENLSEDDIVIVGFPKSGNTWLQHLICGLNYKMTMEESSNRLIRELVPDIHTIASFKRYKKTMFFKSHHLPKENYKKIIYIVRDGRDAMVSYYHMNNNIGKKVSLKEMIYEDKLVFPCSWNKHISAWIDNPYNSNIIYIRYEDLIMNCFNELQKIITFCNMTINDNLVNQIIENCAFNKLRDKEKSIFWDKKETWKENKFFNRKGIIGDYINEMDDITLNYFNEKNFNSLKHFNYL